MESICISYLQRRFDGWFTELLLYLLRLQRGVHMTFDLCVRRIQWFMRLVRSGEDGIGIGRCGVWYER